MIPKTLHNSRNNNDIVLFCKYQHHAILNVPCLYVHIHAYIHIYIYIHMNVCKFAHLHKHSYREYSIAREIDS